MRFLLLLIVWLLAAGTVVRAGPPLTVRSLRIQATQPLPPVRTWQPHEIYESVLKDLPLVPVDRRGEVRYLARWPTPNDRLPEMETALLFWMASLNNRRVNPAPLVTGDGLLYRVYLSDYAWGRDAWEALAESDPYFRVTAAKSAGTIARGWLDPSVEAAVRQETLSRCCVMRADFFIARTSLEVGGTGREVGFYSKFKKLPGTEAELFKAVGLDGTFVAQNYLTRGGAVLESIVALHNRELQLMPSLWGRDEAYVWRSLDTAQDTGKRSVLENFLGTVLPDGREYIGTSLNGLHWYYLSNKDGKQVSFVPQNIAQDKENPHDVTVFTPWKCVACHTPKGGIRHFDDAISKIATHPGTGLGIITKTLKTATTTEQEQAAAASRDMKRIVEDYYLSELGKTISRQQKSYTEQVESVTGLLPADVAQAYLAVVQRYLYDRVDKGQAAMELGIAPAEVAAYLKTTTDPELIVLLSGQTVSREVFEGAFAAGMQSRVYPWERSSEANVTSQPAVVAPARAALRIPELATPAPAHPQDPAGSLRFVHQGLLYLQLPDGRRYVWRNGAWDELD